MNFRKLFIAILFVTMMVSTAFAQTDIVTVSESDWKQDGSDLYVYQNGEMLKDSWVFFDNEWYFVKSDGKVAVNEWVSNLSRTYFAGDDGRMKRNCTETINGKEYVFNSLGASDPAASENEISVWDTKSVKEAKPTKAAEAIDDEELGTAVTINENTNVEETKDVEIAESVNDNSDTAADDDSDSEEFENFDTDDDADTEVAEDVEEDDDSEDADDSEDIEVADASDETLETPETSLTVAEPQKEESTEKKEEPKKASTNLVSGNLLTTAATVTLQNVDTDEGESKPEENTANSDTKTVKADTKTVQPDKTSSTEAKVNSKTTSKVTKGKTYNVLMIGNSKTYFNNMPTMFEKLVNTAYKNGKCDFKVNVEQFAFSGAAKGYNTGGMTLNQIYSKHESKVKAKLQEKKWDFLILQPGSTQVFNTSDITKSLNNYYSIAKKKNSDLKVILYIMNLSEKYNINKYAKIVKNAENAAKKSKIPADKIRLAYAASAFKSYHDKEKSWTKIIRSDKNHPTIEGSYMITCVLYAVITGKTPVGLKYKGKIAKSDVSLSASDFSGKNGTKYCTSSTHKAASNPEYYQKMAWEVEKDKSKY